jgi:hypothetical protein
LNNFFKILYDFKIYNIQIDNLFTG